MRGRIFGMYLTIKEAHTALGVSRQWLHTLVTNGHITATTIYGKRLIVKDKRFKDLQKARKDA